MKRKIIKKIEGFTLIEMIVVAGILAMMVLVSLPAYRSYNRRNQLRLAAEQVRQALVEAQNMALAPKDEGSQWRYGTKKENNRTFIIYKENVKGSSTPLKSYTLPDFIEWGHSDNWNVSFSPPHAKASCIENLSIELQLSGTSDTITVNLNCVSNQITITQP